MGLISTKDTQEIQSSMTSTSPPAVPTPEASPKLPQTLPSQSPSSHRPPASSPPSSCKALSAAGNVGEGADGGPISDGDKQLLQMALDKIQELENRLGESSKNSEPKVANGKVEEKSQEDDDPIITPDGQKVSFLIKENKGVTSRDLYTTKVNGF